MEIKDTGRDLYPAGLEDQIKFGGVDDIALRFYLAARLGKMKYGERVAIPNSIVNHAWPPTGDHDRSFVGAFRALALSAGGHRPESSYTTQERIERDLDETFRVERMYYENDQRWLIERKRHCCPKCRGDGYYEEWGWDGPPPAPVSYMDAGAMVMSEAVVSKKRITCDHAP